MDLTSIGLATLLNAVYSGKDRHYHDITHIHFLHAKVREWGAHEMNLALNGKTGDELVTEEEEALCERIFSIAARVDVAIWWHDFEYNVFLAPGLNEKLSAHAYKTYVTRHDSVVYDAILATANHLEDQIIEDTDDGMVIKVMLDVDLVGFAKPYAAVKRDSLNVLKEYEPLGIPHETMLENRIKFLDKLLKRNRIFYTDYFFNKYEAAARENIQRSIEDTRIELSA